MTSPEGVDAVVAQTNVGKTSKIKDKLNKRVELEKKKTEKLTINDVLAVPIYNYIIYKQLFKGCKHIKLVVSKFEADFMIAKQTNHLIKNGVDPGDITIISRDSDMYILNNKVSIQSSKQYVEANTVSDKLRYVYLVGSDFVSFQMSIEQFVKIDDHEEYRRDVLTRACQHADLKILFSDFLFANYESLEQDV